MNKKWILLFLLGLININLSLFAQQPERRRTEFNELREKRIAFISQTMKLTAEETKTFWPLCNELQGKKIQLNQRLRRALSQFTGNERNRRKHTENEYKEIVNLHTQFRIDEAKLDEEYTLKFAKVISYEKIFLYQQAERQFERQMLDQRREQTPENRRRP